MKNFFKILAMLVLSATVTATMISCGNSKSNNDGKINTNSITEEKEETADIVYEEDIDETETPETVDVIEEAPAKDFSDEITIDETVILDKNGIKITITGYKVDELWGDVVTYSVENNSDVNITVSSDKMYINGFDVVDIIYEDVAPGKIANGEFSVDNDKFIGDAGIFEILLNIYDSDTYDDIFEEEYVYFETSAAAFVEENYDIEGDVLYNQNGFKIISCGMEYDDFWGYTCKLYFENNSGTHMIYEGDNASVNNTMIDAWIYNSLPNGVKCFEEVTLYEHELEDNNIKEIENIEMNFSLLDFDAFYETVDEFSLVIYEK